MCIKTPAIEKAYYLYTLLKSGTRMFLYGILYRYRAGYRLGILLYHLTACGISLNKNSMAIWAVAILFMARMNKFYSLIAFLKSSSPHIKIPSSCALVNLLPASAPARTMSVLLETLLDTVAPICSKISLAASRV